MTQGDESDVDGSQLGTRSADDSQTVGRGRSKVPRLIALLIALVLSGDVAAIVVRRHQTEPAVGPQESAPTVLFRDDFSASTAFRAYGDEEFDSGVQDGAFRIRSERGTDVYNFIPPEAPDRPRVLQAQDVSVAVDVQMATLDAKDWFGVFCRFGGFGTDTYVARVYADGSWSIVRTTIGDEYVKRVLGGGETSGIEGPLPADATVRLT